MIKLILSVLVEAVLGLAVAGIALAIAVPLMIRNELLTSGELPTSILVTGVIVCAVAVMLFRPGSALRRSAKP
jgi:hypothetical protein